MKKITARKLESLGACPEQVAIFRRHFGAGVVPTLELVMRYAQVFDWDWAAKNLLSATADKAYQEATAPAYKAYRAARAQAFRVAWKMDRKNDRRK